MHESPLFTIDNINKRYIYEVVNELGAQKYKSL